MKNIDTKPNFDAHLTEAEMKMAEKIVPLHQAKIHIAIRADFSIDDVIYQQGVICLSEHMITFGRKRVMGKAFHPTLELHLFSIEKMKTLSDYFIVITTDENEIKIYTTEGIRLARTILRDYLLSSSLIPPSRRFEFKPHNGNLFPPFKPSISPSQAFQFTYNAFCSYLDCSYQHEVVRFYHKNLTTNAGIINLNQLPVQLMETNLRLSMDLSPFFNALKYCPYIFGISCTNITRPDLFQAIAPLIEINCNLHILSIENCNIVNGIGELAQAIANNPDIKISYFDLSGNPFADATPLMGAFSAYPHDVFFLDFGNCNLSSSATEMLMTAIKNNEHLWKLGYFHIPYAKINDKSAKIFRDHLRSLSQNGIHSLHSIDFGGIQSGVHHILEGLVSYPQPVDTLRINDSKIKPNSFDALISLIRNSDFLSELNISGTSLKIDKIIQIIKTIQENRNMKKFSLYIGGLKINGPNLETVLNQMKKTASIWVGLGLHNNGLEVSDVELLTRKLSKFTNLSKLELADNFHHSQKGIGDALAKLSQLESLKYFGIKGCKSNGMETEIIPILRSIRSNTKITTLDISFNYSKQEGLESIAELIRKNNSIKQLFIDGNRPKTIDPIIDVMDSIKLNNTILNCPIPNDDIYKAIAKKKSKERARLENIIAQHQNDNYIKLLTNQVNNNVTSFMNLKNVPELDKMINELTAQLANQLQSLQLTMHSAICELIGLNLPFKAETDHDENGGTVIDVEIEAADTYGTKEAKRQVIEQVSEDVSNLQTLQFNSLAIKRTSTGSKIDLIAPQDDSKNSQESEGQNESDSDSVEEYRPKKRKLAKISSFAPPLDD